MRQVLVFSALFAFFAISAEARQAMKLDIQNGRVSLEANGVPVRQILAEWGRIGGTKVVGAEKITGAPLTLKLVNMPERQALDIILRNTAGYMAAPRMASATPGASNYDRILILPTSAGAASSPATASNPAMRPGMAPGPMAGTERRVPMPRPPGMRPTDADADEPVTEPEPDTADNGIPNTGQPVFTFPQQQPGSQVFVPVQGGSVPGTTPQINLQPNPNGQPTIYNFVPQPNMTAPPTNGFGVIGSPTPGVVQQPPAQPGQVPPKPPGPRN